MKGLVGGPLMVGGLGPGPPGPPLKSGPEFGYNIVTARITTPDLYCSASRKPITWTQKAPMHRWTVKKLDGQG